MRRPGGSARAAPAAGAGGERGRGRAGAAPSGWRRRDSPRSPGLGTGCRPDVRLPGMRCWHPGALGIPRECREPLRVGVLVDSQGAVELQGWGFWQLPEVLGTAPGWVCCGLPGCWDTAPPAAAGPSAVLKGTGALRGSGAPARSGDPTVALCTVLCVYPSCTSAPRL